VETSNPEEVLVAPKSPFFLRREKDLPGLAPEKIARYAGWKLAVLQKELHDRALPATNTKDGYTKR
jgi:hypothetical protein